MMKKPYIKSKIKVFKFTPKSLCADSPEAGVVTDEKNEESKSSGGIDWDFYENWDDNK